MFKRILLVFIVAVVLSLASLVSAQTEPTTTPGGTSVTGTSPQTGYADVNGLHMYYEIHGVGEPLVVLHGTYMSIVTMGELIPRLAETRQVIAVELQGHGRTADADRPLTYEQMADDVDALMQAIGVETADFFGYSMGGSTALQIAIRHPQRVDKLVVASASYNSGGWHDDLREMIKSITPEVFAGTPIETDYRSLAPNPDHFPILVEKLVQLDTTVQDWPAEDMQAIESPTLVIIGDSDAIRPEHAVDLFRLRGGGVNGDLTGLPQAQLAIIPGATHTSVLSRADLLIPIITGFLDAAPPPVQ